MEYYRCQKSSRQDKAEFQGKKYELTGSAEEQYTRWRELLRQIYYAETGFRPADVSDRNKPQEQ